MKLTAKQIKRFWSRVVKTPTCWLWAGATRGIGGYGQVSLNHKSLYPHRVAFELTRGEIPDELQIDHLCRNRICVNPAHMETVPIKINVLRGVGPTAINNKKTHCFRGHLFDAVNTYYRKKGGRACRRCRHLDVKIEIGKSLRAVHAQK